MRSRFRSFVITNTCLAKRAGLAALRGSWIASLVGGSSFCANATETGPKPLSAEQIEFFENKIRPLFVNECFRCHSEEAKRLKGDLRLDTREGMLKGGDTGAAIVPGEPDASLLIKAVRYKDEDTAMPPKKKLGDAQIADLEAWVRMGSPWPEKAGLTSPASGGKKAYDWEKFRTEHWAFRKVLKVEPPAVKDAAWVRSPIDNFILAGLEAADRKPASAADKRTLIRRAYLDIIGLPPTPENVAAFESDSSPEAFAKVVDTLLASPQYGERWGRHWLDVARYSDGIGG
jgi:Protein of unknown function (DUF1549)/Planctomycete cytochrome C